jgi:hypothetical protein
MSLPNLTPSSLAEAYDWLGLVERCLVRPASANHFLSARATWAWVQKAREALAVLRRGLKTHTTSATSGAPAIRLATEQGLIRILQIAQQCDDEDGELQQLLHAFVGVLNEALLQAPPPAAWGQWLLNALIEAPSLGTTAWNPTSTLEAAGVLVAHSYEECLVQSWACIPLGTVPTVVAERLHELLVLMLMQKNDVQAVMDFLAETSSCESSDAELIDYAHAQGYHRDALRYAQAAVERFPHSPRLQELLLRAYESCGVHARLSLALRQDVFAQEPNVKNFQALLRAGEAAGVGINALREQAYGAVAAQEKSGLKPTVQVPLSRSSRTGVGLADQNSLSDKWLTPESWWMLVRGPDVTARVSLLLFEGHWQEALQWVAIPNVCDAQVLMALAQVLPHKQDDEALALLDRAMRLDLACEPPRLEWALVRVAMALRRLAGIEKALNHSSLRSKAAGAELGLPDKKSALLQRLQGEFHQSHAEFVAGLARL